MVLEEEHATDMNGCCQHAPQGDDGVDRSHSIRLASAETWARVESR